MPSSYPMSPRDVATSRLIAQAEGVLAALEAGSQLLDLGAGEWRLSTGARVSALTARLVIKNIRVAGAGDGLFPGFSQTYRWRDQ
jgi:hypothetical protein